MAKVVHRYFEWDDAKALLNLKQHGVSFVEAVTVFDDPFFATYYSEEHYSKRNDMSFSVCRIQNRLLVVVFTERRRIQIISARELTARERRNYEASEKEF